MKNTEEQVLAVYQEENPSIHGIEHAAAFHRLEAKRTKLFHDALKFPPKMFQGCRLVDVGAGTGENTIFFSRWGARCTLVDMNAAALARARLIFNQYSPRPARYVQASLFTLPPLESFDLVACLGVIHHTADKIQALDVLASLVKPGGYILLGAGNAAGAWQRMLQRLLVYRFGTSTDLIGRTAAYLFPEHLKRASRWGQRTRRAIIFDTYVNPKIDCLTMPELLRWCRSRAMSVYSAAPDFIPPFRGDAPMGEFDITAHTVSGMMAELVWMLHHEPDERGVPDLLRSSQKLARSLERFVSFIHDVSPTREYRLSELLARADALAATAKASDPWAGLRGKLLLFIRDVRAVLTVAARNDLPALRRAIQKTRVLFKGTSGLGMNYYVLHKPD